MMVVNATSVPIAFDGVIVFGLGTPAYEVSDDDPRILELVDRGMLRVLDESN